MIKRLRTRVILMSMISLFIVLAVIMTTVNVLNFVNVTNEADGTLDIISSNKGNFPEKELPGEKKRQPHKKAEKDKGSSPELPYESRYFSVVVSPAGEVISYDTENVVAVDGETAKQLALNVIQSGDNNGYSGYYRFLVTDEESKQRVTFLDCTRSINTCNSFLLVSVLISIGGLLSVFILVWILSKKLISPIIEGHEKQKRFITDAGHEIKTPITIIEADAEVLSMDLGENEWLADIRRQTKRLSTLTNDLIFLSKMEEERELAGMVFSISDTACEEATSFSTVAKTRNINIVTDIQEASYKGDPKIITQLFSVLLDNAVKYSPNGDNINLNLKKQSKNILIEVENTAPEMSSEQVEIMFDRFYRGDRSRNSKEGGYGLGLSVASAIVNAYKGKISASLNKQRLKITVVLPM